MFSLIKAITLSQDELDTYYVEQRAKVFEKTGGVPSFVKLHNVLHMMLVPAIKGLRTFGGIKLTVCGDERRTTIKPVVYACTHIGGTDIETAFEVIADPCWLFLGNPREVYKNFDGFMLGLNGVICLDSKAKNDRRIAKETAVQLLLHGGNLLIFPEGAWNITENLPVMGLYTGAVEIAIRTHAEIVPVALECYGKEMCVVVGENIDVSSLSLDEVRNVNARLRDTLATLKWKIWESRGVQARADIPSGFGEIFVERIINQNKDTSYSLEEALSNMFLDRNITTFDEAFAHLNLIKPNRNNAFLFNKRLK